MSEEACNPVRAPTDNAAPPPRAVRKCRQRGLSEFEVQDDSGHWVPCLNWGHLNHQASPDAVRVLTRIGEMTRPDMSVGSNSTFTWFEAGLFVALMFLMVIAMGLRTVAGNAIAAWTVPVVCVAAGCLCARNGKRRHRQRLTSPAAAYALREGLCAGCGYALAGINPDNAGLLRCPECSAAWRADAVRVEPDALRQALAPVRNPTGVRNPVVAKWLGLAAKKGTDDRGNPVVLVRSTLDSERASARDPEHKHRLNTARRAMRLPTLPIRVLSAALIVGVFAGPMLVVIGRGLIAPDWVMVLCITYMVLIWVLATLLGDVGITRARIRRRMLGHGLCPSCAHDLTGTEDAEDGRVECPRCGGAWLMRSVPPDESAYAAMRSLPTTAARNARAAPRRGAFASKATDTRHR